MKKLFIVLLIIGIVPAIILGILKIIDFYSMMALIYAGTYTSCPE